MKLTNFLLLSYSLSFITINAVACNPYGASRRFNLYDDCIGFSYNNSSSDTQDVTIYYGSHEIDICDYLDYFDNYEEIIDVDTEVKLSIRRSVYESTLKKKEECPCKETEIYSKILKFRDFLSYDYIYGNNNIVDTITKDDLYNNEDGYGYIIYDLCFTETDGVESNDTMMHYFSEDRLKTKEIYYTIDDNLITLKIAKQEY